MRRPLRVLAVLSAAAGVAGCFLEPPQLGPALLTDVTSDLNDPPAFHALAAERQAAGFPAVYPGETAAQQKYAHPEIKPLSSTRPPAEVYARALDLVRRNGWQVVETAPPGAGPGRIEARAKPTAVSVPDDVIIRIAAERHGSRIDMRSAARHGRRDLGTNARRVSGFLFELRDVLLSANAN